MEFYHKLINYFKNILDAFLIFDQKSIFKSSGKEKTLHGITFYDNKKVNEIKYNKIITYPRISIFEKKLNEHNAKIIFDSSDFWYINNVLANSVSQFSKGVKFELKDFKYEIIDIKVDVLEHFDDYSLKNKDNNNHSTAYLGEDIPYNIQIQIFVIKST